ncbi:SAM-dependent methyltransferase [Metallosphaera sedula]|uniref:SAM-dependent methyltransferase n=1 Tax=Metallosphaera prunae TaxID=47304 RepID=A0A4D8RUL6_METPR|nr:SAM-dependent methyltransferase [Metallosphaera prunae]
MFKYGDLEIEIPQGYEYVYYATLLQKNMTPFTKEKDDVVMDSGAFVSDYTVRVTK